MTRTTASSITCRRRCRRSRRGLGKSTVGCRRRDLSRRAGGPWPARADDHRLALDQGRLREFAAVRPHLGDPLPGGALRRDGAADHAVAARGVRRPDQRCSISRRCDATSWPQLPGDRRHDIADVDLSCKLHHPALPLTNNPFRRRKLDTGLPGRCPTTFMCRARWTKRARYRLDIENTGQVGATLTVYAIGSSDGPWNYTVEAGKRLVDNLPIDGQHYAFGVFGPNGFLREFRGRADGAKLEISTGYDAKTAELVLRIGNVGADATITTAANDYSTEPPRTHVVAALSLLEDRWNVAASAHWYDLSGEMYRRTGLRLSLRRSHRNRVAELGAIRPSVDRDFNHPHARPRPTGRHGNLGI